MQSFAVVLLAVLLATASGFSLSSRAPTRFNTRMQLDMKLTGVYPPGNLTPSFRNMS